MKTEAGFTVIEVLIAIVILSFGLLALANMQVLAIQVNSAANRLSRGTTLVQDKIEELMTLPYTHTDLADSTPVNTCQTHSENPLPGYTLTWCVDTNAINTSKTVNITATWQNGTAPPKEFKSSVVVNN